MFGCEKKGHWKHPSHPEIIPMTLPEPHFVEESRFSCRRHYGTKLVVVGRFDSASSANVYVI